MFRPVQDCVRQRIYQNGAATAGATGFNVSRREPLSIPSFA
jgi:hypothetical protein